MPLPERLRTRTGYFHYPFLLVFALLCAYWYFHLPPPGKAVLAIGVAAVLMAVCEMKPRHKAFWLALVFLLAFLESKSINVEQDKSKNAQDEAYKLAKKTADGVTQTQTELALLSIHMDDLNAKQQEARARGDSKEVNEFQAEKKEARKQVLLSVVPGLCGELDNISAEWSSQRKDPTYQGVLPFGRLNARWLGQARPWLTTADSLRQQLLQELPLSARTPEDTSDAALFARAASPSDLTTIANYLRELSSRVAAADAH